jgi:hypothetical protein
MDCGAASLLALLSRSIRYGNNDCASIITDGLTAVAGPPGCDDPPLETRLIGLFSDTGVLRIEPASFGEVTELDCDDTDVAITALLSEAIYPADGGGFVLATWEDGEVYACQQDCDDGLTVEQRLRACFIRQDNGVLRLRVTTTSDSVVGTCSELEAAESILSRCLVMVDTGKYAIRITA